MGRIHLILYGTVQGVGFRAFARHAARAAGVDAGWVRNRMDGGVEIEAEGDDAAVAHFRDLVTRGPAYARVGRVEHLEPTTRELPRPFAIVH